MALDGNQYDNLGSNMINSDLNKYQPLLTNTFVLVGPFSSNLT